jgi:signal transduction histidine kinase
VNWKDVLLGPVSRRTWLGTAHLLIGAPIALAAALAVGLCALTGSLLAITLVGIPLGFSLFFGLSHWFGRVQASRFEAFLGVRVRPRPRDYPGATWVHRVANEAQDRRAWREAGFHLAAPVIEGAGAAVVTLSWAFGLVLSTITGYSSWLPAESGVGWDPHSAIGQTIATAAGVSLLFLTPWLVRGFTALDVLVAEALLAPSRTDELTHRVEVLAESRTKVVDAADAERRRIERDLHDGTQQRLVSLAMNLGMTRAQYPDIPEIAEAHEEAKLALTELRDFVRGLHPAVLNDRGLDAALSGIAARSPVPVRLHVDLPVRPGPTTEAIAYFVVSEALANAAKHSRAGAATVTVTRKGETMIVEIEDDGVGGAHPGKGSGLRGLAQRVESADGRLTLTSPEGGPTLIVAELPCAS